MNHLSVSIYFTFIHFSSLNELHFNKNNLINILIIYCFLIYNSVQLFLDKVLTQTNFEYRRVLLLTIGIWKEVE